MASPLGAVSSGVLIAATTFVENVGNDLFDNGGDWSEINWGQAAASGILSGAVSGTWKIGVNVGQLFNGFDKFTQQSFPAAKALAKLGKWLVRLSKFAASGMPLFSG